MKVQTDVIERERALPRGSGAGQRLGGQVYYVGAALASTDVDELQGRSVDVVRHVGMGADRQVVQRDDHVAGFQSQTGDAVPTTG